jgi:hypothetical protein
MRKGAARDVGERAAGAAIRVKMITVANLLVLFGTRLFFRRLKGIQ